MKLALLALVTAVLSSPSLAQSTVTHVDPLLEPNFSRVQVGGVVNHPDGGVVSVFRPVDQSAAQLHRVVFRRLNEAGDRVWTVERGVPTSITALVSFNVDAFMTPRGSTIALLQYGTVTRMMSVDRNGAFEWDRRIQSSVNGTLFLPISVGSTSTGDVYIAGGMDSSTLPLFDGRATLRLLEGGTGTELWRYETPAFTRFPSWSNASFSTDDAFLVFEGPNGVTAERVDRNGQLVYSTSGLQPGLTTARLIASGATPGGELSFSHVERTVPIVHEGVALDSAGAVRWRRRFNQAPNVSLGAVTDAGELLFVGGTLVAGTVTQIVASRFDASGALRWQNPNLPLTWTYRHLRPSGDGGALIVGDQPAPTGAARLGRLLLLEANGASSAIESFVSIGSEFGYLSAPVNDPRGNTWLGASRYESPVSFPKSAITIKVSKDDIQDAWVCTQFTNNSSGFTGRLRATGSGVVARNNVTLVADRLPPQQFVLFLNATATGFAANPGGTLGDLCLGGTVGRYVRPGEIRRTSPAGLASLLLELPATPSGPSLIAITQGQTWNFQAWHRDVVAGAAVSNLTDAIAVTFQ